MYSNQSIFDSLPILAVAFGRRQNIEVRIGGNQAYTDGRLIQLPSMPLDSPPELATLAFGYLYHETGHIEFTDMNVTAEATQAGPFIKQLENTFEDVRMEGERNATYPGSARALSDLVAEVVKRGQFGTADSIERAGPQDVLTMYLVTRLRHEVLDQPCGEVAALWEPRVKTMLGDTGMVKLDALLDQVQYLDVSADCLALARKVATLIEEEAKDPPPPPESQPGEGEAEDGQGRQGEEDGQDQDQNSGPTQSSGASSTTDQDGEADQQDGSSNPSAQSADGNAPAQPDRAALKQILAAGAGDFRSGDLGDMVSEELSDAAEEARKQACDKGAAVFASTPLEVDKAPDGTSELELVLGESQQLRTKLAIRMQSQEVVRSGHRRQGHRLDGNVAHRLVIGDTRVFQRRARVHKVNTAVQLLLDVSGSMSGENVVLARRAMLAAAVGISQIDGCKVAAAAFPSLQVMKEFDEPARVSARRFSLEADGGTPLAQALVWAAASLSLRREERKMLVVATDGAPDDSVTSAELIRRYARAGVDVIGIGIGTGSVQHLFPMSAVITSVAELPTTMFNLLSNRMRRVA